MHARHLLQTHSTHSVATGVLFARLVENSAVPAPVERGAVTIGYMALKTSIRVQVPVALLTCNTPTLYATTPLTTTGATDIPTQQTLFFIMTLQTL